MSKKIIIFITTFIITGIVILGVYFWINKNKTNPDGSTPWYQEFNPFGTGSIINNNIGVETDPNNQNLGPDGIDNTSSRFYQITDFAVAGATFLEDTRPIDNSTIKEVAPQEIKTTIDANTKEGRKEIQTILNKELSLTKPLVTDGVFGKLAISAIKEFQKKNNLTITGKIDNETAPFFTKTTIIKPEISTTEIAPSVRYVEKKNGHIYKMFLDTKNKEKISNSTIPGIQEAFFDKTGNTVVYRYLSSDKLISSFMATLGAPKGEFLPQNISDFSPSLDKEKFFYITKNKEGSVGTIGLFSEPRRDSVFNSPFTEWLSQWDNNQNIFLTSKASGFVEGNIFKLNTTNKTLTKTLGNILGLTTLVSPDGSLVLYSSSTKNGPLLGIFDIENHKSKDLKIFGLPEKCIWSSDSINVYCAIPNTLNSDLYPDVWYQGLVSFDDFFVKINTENENRITIANSINETPIDAISLFLDKTEENLFFLNKKDYTLWGLKLINN